jgi:O-antigen ligase
MNLKISNTHTTKLASWAGFTFFSLTILLIYMPSHVSSTFLLLSLPFMYMRRNEIVIETQFKKAFMIFIIYLIFFTITSAHLNRSVKGTFDILVGTLLFPIALLLARDIHFRARSNALLILVSILIIGNLFFARPQGFYSYHPNPNNGGVTLWLFALFAWFGVAFTRQSSKHPYTAILLFNIIVGALCLYLILLTNARGVWLALASGALAMLLFVPQLKKSHKLILSAAILLIFLSFFLLVNTKGESLTGRPVIWAWLFNHTIDGNFWLGYGINVVKDVLAEDPIFSQKYAAQTAHNIFLEIFVSTGIVGLGVFVAILGWIILFTTAL